MKRYFIIRTTKEIKCTRKVPMSCVIVEGCTDDDFSPEIEKEFPSLEEAISDLKYYTSDASLYSGSAYPYFYVTEFSVIVENGEYDEDGEWVVDNVDYGIKFAKNTFAEDCKHWDGYDEDSED